MDVSSRTNTSDLAISAPANGVIVSDAILISEILRSKDFHVVDYARHYGEIADRTGLNLDATVQAMKSMPLANEDAAHRELRSSIARAVSQDWREISTVMHDHVAELVRHSFQSGREIDLVGEFAFPIFSHLYGLWSGLALDAEPGVSQVFCGRMSLNRRRQIDASLTRLDSALDHSTLRIPKDVAVSFAILASDALVGSLSLSLWEIFSAQSGGLISEVSFPEALPATAVPYIDRVASTDITLHDSVFAKGQRVRLLLEGAVPGQSEQAGNLFFGVGRHLCVGKSMTNMIWKSIVESLALIELRATPVSLVMRKPDHVFRYPQSARVRLHG